MAVVPSFAQTFTVLTVNDSNIGGNPIDRFRECHCPERRHGLQVVSATFERSTQLTKWPITDWTSDHRWGKKRYRQDHC